MSAVPVELFLGVDGGGSKTLAVIVDALGRERGRGVAGSSNQEAAGFAVALTELRAAVARATVTAGAALPLRAAWLGLAGVDRPEDGERFSPEVRALAEIVRITNDAELALGALPRMAGVALIAGTGSIALGRDTRGVAARVGGWGHVLGDEGSGYAIGQQALQAAARAADGRGPPTTLLERILAYWRLQASVDLIERAYQPFDKTAIAALAPLVLMCAREGDGPARGIVTHAVEELALAAITVTGALDFPAGRVPLALGGGLLLRAASLRARVLRGIARTRAMDAVLVKEPALSGARALAAMCAGGDDARLAGIEVNGQMHPVWQRNDRTTDQ